MSGPTPPLATRSAAVQQTVADILVGLGIDRGDVAADARLRADLELDSTETVEVTLELKRRLDVEVQLESGEDLTVAQVCDRVASAAADAP